MDGDLRSLVLWNLSPLLGDSTSHLVSQAQGNEATCPKPQLWPGVEVDLESKGTVTDCPRRGAA